MVRVIQVIEAKERRGIGTDENPFRMVIQYYDFDGNLLFERDSFLEEQKEKCQNNT